MPDRIVKAGIKLASSDWEMRFQVEVSEAPISAKELLPMAQSLSDAVVNSTVREMEARGGKISCCKGCGACCRQLVPISEAEARRIAELVESLQEPRRSQVKARFEDAANVSPRPACSKSCVNRIAGIEKVTAHSAWNISARRFPVRSWRMKHAQFTRIDPSPAESFSSQRLPYTARTLPTSLSGP
jgi:hypothetical protein